MNELSTKKTVYSVDAISKIDKIFEYISASPEPVSFTRIYTDLDLPKSSTYRLVEALVNLGYLEKDSHNRFILGFRLYRLGTIAGERIDLRKAAHKYLVSTTEKIGLTISLATMNSAGQGIYLDRVEPRGIALNKTRVGDEIVMHCSCLGKVLLAWQLPGKMEEMCNVLPLNQQTPNSITDLEALKMELRMTRERGYAIDNEELDMNIVGIGVPIFDYNGELAGAISVGAISALLTKEQIPSIVEHLKECSRQISQKLIC